MWPKDKPHPPAYSNGPSDWMLVDTSMVQLRGTECNKVGVSYTGFRRQSGRCQAKAGSCFHNQPLQLWEYDD
ncbi:Hapless 2, partial [Geodia barretti]